MPLSQTEYLWSGATPLLLISPARFFLYKGPKIDYFLRPPLDYRLLFALVSLPATLRTQPGAGRARAPLHRIHHLRGGVQRRRRGSVRRPRRSLHIFQALCCPGEGPAPSSGVLHFNLKCNTPLKRGEMRAM